MDHKSPDKILRFGVVGWDPYDTTRNTGLDFKVTLNDTSGGFHSSGNITITVGATDFTKLSSSSPTVEIKLSGGSIKKYKDPDSPPTGGNLIDIKGTSEPLNPGTKLELEATGRISKPNIDGSEVTIKATVTVTSEDKPLGNTLTLAGLTSEDPRSQGLTGTITPEGGSKVQIQTGSITLTSKSLEAFLSLTKNAVTLSGSSSTTFRSSASIIITRTSGDVDFKKLTVADKLQIHIKSGTIKRLDDKGKPIELKTDSTRLSVGDKLSLDATGTLSGGNPPASGSVTLTATIVVTSNNKTIGGNTLNFGGGPNSQGVDGSLSLTDATSENPKYVKITGGSNLTIESAAYEAIQKASDTTSSSFTIGAITNIK